MGSNANNLFNQLLLQNLTGNAALQAAQYGLPGGQSLPMPVVSPGGAIGMVQAPQQKTGFLNKVMQAAPYVGDVLTAVNSAQEGQGWIGPAINSMVTRRNLTNFNQQQQAIRQAQMVQKAINDQAIVRQAQQFNPNIQTAEQARQYMEKVAVPVQAEELMRREKQRQGSLLERAYAERGGLPYVQRRQQTQQPVFQMPSLQGQGPQDIELILNQTDTQIYPEGQQPLQAGATQQTLGFEYGLTPDEVRDMRDYYAGRQDTRFTQGLQTQEFEEKKRATGVQERLKRQQQAAQRAYQQGQLGIGRRNVARQERETQEKIKSGYFANKGNFEQTKIQLGNINKQVDSIDKEMAKLYYQGKPKDRNRLRVLSLQKQRLTNQANAIAGQAQQGQAGSVQPVPMMPIPQAQGLMPGRLGRSPDDEAAEYVRRRFGGG